MRLAEEVAARWSAYPAYQDSGVPWIGPIPVGWEVRRLRQLMQLNPRKSEQHLPAEVSFVPMEAVSEDGWMDASTVRPVQEVESGYTYFREGDLVMAKVTPCFENGKGAIARGLTGDVGFGSTEFHVLRATPKMGVAFAYYLTMTPGFRKLGESVMYGAGGQKRVPTEFLRDVLVPAPSPTEQQAIASFLARETARIDELLREQQGLLEDLALRRAALIFEGTTKGLGGAPLRDSGAAWAGQVPAHWEFVNLRSVARLESGHTPSRSKPEYWEACTIPWVSLSDVRRFRDGRLKYIEDTEEKISELGMANSAARLLPQGTVILSRTASVGFSAILGTDMATTQDFANWVCGPRLLPEYLLYVLRGMKHEFARLMMGSTHQTIYMPDIRELQVPLPPLAEQQAIADHLDTQLAQIDALTEEVRASIALMRQHRSALITAAVTGKIDVRQA